MDCNGFIEKHFGPLLDRRTFRSHDSSWSIRWGTCIFAFDSWCVNNLGVHTYYTGYSTSRRTSCRNLLRWDPRRELRATSDECRHLEYAFRSLQTTNRAATVTTSSLPSPALQTLGICTNATTTTITSTDNRRHFKGTGNKYRTETHAIPHTSYSSPTSKTRSAPYSSLMS